MTETTKIENSNDKIAFNSFNMQLGVAANLVKGYAPGWNPANGKLDILNRPKEQPMKPQIPEPSGKKGDWEYPVISLHETADSLITELLGYKVEAPAIDDAPPSLPAGSLLLSAPTAQKAKEALKETLGVSLEDTTLRYALVKLTKFDETLLHTTKEHGILTTVHALKPDPRIGVNADFMRSMARLRHFPVSAPDTFTDLTPADANAYLTQFAQYGTHFVSSISVGDQIVQVFAYEEERFKKVKEGFEKNDFTGPNSVDFRYYTTDANKGKFAYVKEYGKILCFSNNKKFQESMNQGLWNEKFWAKQNSVFQIFSEDTGVSRRWLNNNLTEQAPIQLTLAPLTTFTEYKRTTVWRQIFKAAMSTVFGDTINPNFKPQDDTDFSKIILEDQPGVISTIATPTINIYKARLDLEGMQFKAQEEVKTFISYGYVVSGTSKNVVSLPGENVRLFGYKMDMRASGQPNIISLSSKGFEGLQLGCEHFLGVARFQTTDGNKHFLVTDGLRYDLDGNGWPSVTHDVRQPPSTAYLSDLKDSIEFSLAFGESVLGIQSGTKGDSPTQALARGYLKWVGKVIPDDTQNPDLLTMRFRALDLSNYSPNSGYRAFVPILPATEYENSVEKILDYLQEIQRQIGENNILIEQRKQAELINVTAKTLNENIVQSGELLTGLIKANAQASKDLSGYYDSVIKANEKEAKDQQSKINALSNAVFEQQAEVDKAGQKYKAAVEKWQTMEAIKFGLEVVTNTFSVGTAITIPSSTLSGVKELGTMAQRIQKLLNVLNATMKIYSSSSGSIKNISDANKALDGLDDMGYGDITALNWEELILNLDTVMAHGPNIPAKNEVVNAFKILSARGKTLASAQSNLLQIQRDIYTTQCQKALSKREEDRLNKLVGSLHPAKIEELDKEAIDLVGLTRSLDYLRQQMLTTLAKTFLLQDQALQYAWLQNPTPIASYSLLTFMRSRITQSQETERAKSLLLQYQASTTNPISLDIKGVIAENISNGNMFEIIIDPNHPKFKEYVNLRVQSVVAEIIGVKSTESGKLLVKLTFENKPFTDRNIERENLRFNTPWRERIYEYDLATGKPNFTDEGKSWSEGVNCVTPFGAWGVSLPKTQTNRGLVFKNGVTVDIRLTFTVKARIVDASRRVMNKDNTQIDNRALKAEALHKRIMAQAGIRGSQDDLIKTLYNVNDATNGWDVVFNMELESINSSLRDQYKDIKNNEEYKTKISDIKTSTSGITVDIIKKICIEYGYPLLTFEENNSDTVKLEMNIDKGTLTICEKNKKTGEEICGDPTSISSKKLTAYVKLEKVSVTLEGHNVLNVILKMENGAFSIENIGLEGEESAALHGAIKAYFVKNKVEYLINKLDLTYVPTLDAMKPNGFLFKVLQTEAKVNILQLFIQTGSRPLQGNSETHLNNVREPLPVGSETSLLVRSGLFFSEVLPESLDKNKGWRLEGKQSSYNKKWYAEFNSAPVSAYISLSEFNEFHDYGSGDWSKTTYNFDNNKVDFNLSGMSYSTDHKGMLNLNLNQEYTLNVNENTHWHYYPGNSHDTKDILRFYTILEVSGVFSTNVLGSGCDQYVLLNLSSRGVNIKGNLSGGGPCGTDSLEAKVNQEVAKVFPPQIKIHLDELRFEPISTFAIKNLLFPEKNYINFETVAVPGDMLILGNFNKDKKAN